MASYRLILLLALVLLGLAFLLTMEWPSYSVHLSPLRSPLAFTISLAWPLAGLLTGAMAFGAATIFAQHPTMVGRPRLDLVALWPLPTLIAGLSTLLLHHTVPTSTWVTGIAVTGALLYALFHLEYLLIDQSSGKNAWVEWILQALAYVLALAYFSLIYQARLRTLLSAPLILAVTVMLTMRLLHMNASNWHGSGVCILSIGLTMAESTYALSVWPGPTVIGGVLLFLVFYVLTGLAQRGLESRLTRTTLVEYGMVALAGMGLLLRFG